MRMTAVSGKIFRTMINSVVDINFSYSVILVIGLDDGSVMHLLVILT